MFWIRKFLTTSNVSPTNLNELSIKYQSYPKSDLNGRIGTRNMLVWQPFLWPPAASAATTFYQACHCLATLSICWSPMGYPALFWWSQLLGIQPSAFPRLSKKHFDKICLLYHEQFVAKLSLREDLIVKLTSLFGRSGLLKLIFSITLKQYKFL